MAKKITLISCNVHCARMHGCPTTVMDYFNGIDFHPDCKLEDDEPQVKFYPMTEIPKGDDINSAEWSVDVYIRSKVDICIGIGRYCWSNDEKETKEEGYPYWIIFGEDVGNGFIREDEYDEYEWTYLPE